MTSSFAVVPRCRPRVEQQNERKKTKKRKNEKKKADRQSKKKKRWDNQNSFIAILFEKCGRGNTMIQGDGVCNNIY